MSPTTKQTLELEDIHTPYDVQLLDDIDRLRSGGISHLVALPQLIVVGDQSSGKSSVLEAVSGIPFPTKDNLCTRFATEVVLRRTSIENVKVTISPGPGRDPDSATTLQEFGRHLSDWKSLGEIIDAAKISMGLDDSARAFTDDVLRVDISGPQQPHLTIVDLPGLIHSHSRTQTEADVKIVQQLVRGYMNSARSIILAIVSAKNDYANQVVLKLAREVDPKGVRTLGIITKPDTLGEGSESETAYMSLAQNEDVTFALGWHVLKNRDFTTHNFSLEDRNRDELEFLSRGVWARLPRSNVAISPLRKRLSRVLLSQIKRELPELVQEIERKAEDTKTELRKIGDARCTESEQRRFLLRLSQEYQVLARAALDGVYENPFFGNPRDDNNYNKRVRAVLQNLSLDFAEAMRKRGHKFVVSNSRVSLDQIHPAQEPMTHDEYLEHARDLLQRGRGRELPGTFNPMLIGDLFHEQCSPWRDLLQHYAEATFVATSSFVQLVIRFLTHFDVSERILQDIIEPKLRECKLAMTETLQKLLTEHQKLHPMTFNHYFTETIQKTRTERLENELTRKLEAFMGPVSGDGIARSKLKGMSATNLVKALSIRSEVDMDKYACREAIDCMFAYYKVAMKTIVDNMARQCVEQILVSAIPDAFSPERVLDMDPVTVQRIAQESEASVSRRTHLLDVQALLDSGLDTCRRHRTDAAADVDCTNPSVQRLPNHKDIFAPYESNDSQVTDAAELDEGLESGTDRDAGNENDVHNYLGGGVTQKAKKNPKKLKTPLA